MAVEQKAVTGNFKEAVMNRVYRIADIEKNLKKAGVSTLDVLVVGSTGAGKSSTLNALFQREVAKVGYGCDPETTEISSANLNEKLRFWDSPGLGDNIDKDEVYSKKLMDCLYKTWEEKGRVYGTIDLVLVILDGSGRDMGTTYKLLNDVIIPNFPADRILVAINQADVALKANHWNQAWNCPDEMLRRFLEDKVTSVQERIEEATGIEVYRPVYYSAEKNYNVEKLLDMIIDNMPQGRRVLAKDGFMEDDWSEDEYEFNEYDDEDEYDYDDEDDDDDYSCGWGVSIGATIAEFISRFI